MELLSKLGIDWKLLIAQAVNFFILLFVLVKFVYKPVLEMLDKRAKLIEKGVHDAKISGERLTQIERERDTTMAKAQKEVGAMFEQAKADAEAMKKDIVAAARSEADDVLRKVRLQMAEEKEKMLYEVKTEVVGFIVEAAGKILEREFSHADQKRLQEVVSKEMQSNLSS